MDKPFEPSPPAGTDANPFAPPRVPAGMPDPFAAPVHGRGLVGHVMPVAILMIIQGGLEIFMGIVYLGISLFVPAMIRELPAGQGMPPPESLQSILFIVYGLMGGGGIVAGLLHVTAGIFGLRFRRRVLGVVALIVGLASLSTVYCAPTTIALAIYGLITYCNSAVVAAFALGDAGMPAAGIRARFGG